MPSDPIQHLRELLAKLPPGPWSVDKRGLPAVYVYAPNDKNDIPSVLMYQGDARVHKANLIVAAINALPALLAVAEAADAYMRHKFPNGDQSSMVTFSMQTPKLADDLLDALAKLYEVRPNAQDHRAVPAPVHPIVGQQS